MTFRFRHVLAALALHAALFAVMLGGLQCSRKPERPPVIQAVLLDPDRKETAQQKRFEEQRRTEERKRREDEARRKAEAERKQREVDEQKRKDAEQKRLAEEQRQKQLAEQQRQQKEIAEKKKADELARQREEQERRERDQRDLQERARLEEQMREEAMRREIEREAQARAATEADAERAVWIAAVQNKVTAKWHPPPLSPDDFVCTVRVQQLPDGTVTSARIVKSCGTAQLDASVEEAVLRASPLPTVSNRSLYLREFLFEFIP